MAGNDASILHDAHTVGQVHVPVENFPLEILQNCELISKAVRFFFLLKVPC